MSEPLAPDLLAKPAPESARRVALAQLRRAEAAAERVADRRDPEALHDFRVAVRRLRSLLRAHRPLLDGGASPKVLRRLRRVARSTNAGRDAEVQAAWLRARFDAAPRGAARRGAEWLSRWLDGRRETEYSSAVARSRRRFSRLAPDLRQELATYRVTLEPAAGGASGGDRSYGHFMASRLRDDVDRLRRRLAELAEEPGEVTAHRTRLAAKRLRYDLEPLLELLPEEQAVGEDLKRLQDLLGELNDANVFLRTLERAVVAAAEERARAAFAAALAGGSASAAARRRHPAGGLLALADLASERQRAAERAVGAWSSGDSEATLWAGAERVAVAIAPDAVG